MILNAAEANYMNAETAVALMIAAGLGGSESTHPDELIYTDSDPDYELPESITPLSGETFDTVTEIWKGETEDQDVRVVWGVGITSKDTDNEIVTRLIYPDATQMAINGFDF